jgi:alanyl-tRNA synthetase
MLTGSEIRRKFLDFFVQKGHKEVHSSSLVPANDPTLLFTNAGMNQFKDVFLGLEKRDYNKATTSQKCVRAGGKHNDLENVGFTNRHHTFFEMLGNFSFGDYFKKDAIAYAWELITSKEWFGIDKGKLYVTVFNGEGGVPRDVEAYDLWAAQGVPKDRIFEMGLKDNFWQMGDTGPCGPCSEIHYDMGVAASEQGHADCHFPCDCGRYVEIWNLVFMQFDRDASGKLNPLPKPSIDTGMGLERVAAVLQGVISNYETDLFVPLIKRAAELTGTSLTKELEKEAKAKSAASLRVIADHSRAATFLIADGLRPDNLGRGYILRKIIRRAVRHATLLGEKKPILHAMVRTVVDIMKDAYPELVESADRIASVIEKEERRFLELLRSTQDLLDDEIQRIVKDSETLRREGRFEQVFEAQHNAVSELRRRSREVWEKWGGSYGARPTFSWQDQVEFRNTLSTDWVDLIPTTMGLLHARSDPDRDFQRDYRRPKSFFLGEQAFYLFSTHGLPRDFIEDAARDAGVFFDSQGFEWALEAEQARARASWKGGSKQTANPVYEQLPKSTFDGYRQTRSEGCEVLAIIVNNSKGVRELAPGDEGEVILDHTSFYATSGGQVGDKGWLTTTGHHLPGAGSQDTRIKYFGLQSEPYVVADVTGCYSPIQGVRAHQVIAKQTLRVGDKIDAVVNADIRESTMRNHTATHLLHAGLREVLGKHVKQAGSLVAPNHLRFDFSHFTAVEDEELQDIEDIINKEVLRNQIVETITDVPIDEAINTYHAMALFGEKYGDKVRVVRIGDFSTELCGGTHTGATGEIGLIKILKEGSVSSGVRRVEAITGLGSLAHFRKDHELEAVVSTFAVPTFAHKPRKDGAPSAEEISAHADSVSPAQALKAELEKKDSEIKRLTRELDQARMKSASSSTANISDKVKDVKGVKVLAHRVDNLERAQMRTLIDQLRDKIGSGVVVLGSASNGTVSLIVGVTKDLTDRVQAGKVIGPVAQKVGGKGGGRPDLAEAGGKDAAALDSALDGAYAVVESLLP